MQKYVFKSSNFESIQIPTIQEKRGADFVSFGSNNLYPDLLIELYNNSAMHRTAVEAKTDAVYGDGIKQFGDEIVNQDGETMNEVFEKIVKDYILFGGFAMNVVHSRGGDTIAEYYHLPFNNVRSGKLTENDKIEEYWYSSDWKQHRKYKPTAYPAFSLTDNKGEKASQIYYYFDYTIGQFYYPLPSYVGAVNDIDTDARISRFHANNLKNGLAPSMMLTFRNGIPPLDEQQEIWRDIDNTFAGEEQAGKFFVNFSEPGREPTVEPIRSENDDYYVTLEERITSRILTAHRITSPLLLGIKDSSGFSSNADEINTAFAHFLGTVIIPDQEKLLKAFGKIVRGSGLNVKLEIEQSTILYTEDTIDVITEDVTENTEE